MMMMMIYVLLGTRIGSCHPFALAEENNNKIIIIQ